LDKAEKIFSVNKKEIVKKMGVNLLLFNSRLAPNTVLWSWWESNPRPDKEPAMPSTCLVLLLLSGFPKVQAGPIRISLFVLSYHCITTLQQPDLHDDARSLTRQVVGLTGHLVT
jgi:hypothetical protein